MEHISKLESENYQKICKQADELLNKEQYNEAIDVYREALASLPEGRWVCESYAYTGMGEAYQKLGDYRSALRAFMLSYLEEQRNNPYIILNIGVCYHHLQDSERAIHFLLRAYQIDGESVFEGAEEYFPLIRDLIR